MRAEALMQSTLKTPIDDTVRTMVAEDLPELDLIGDAFPALCAIEAWAIAISGSSFRRIRDIPGEREPGHVGAEQGRAGSTPTRGDQARAGLDRAISQTFFPRPTSIGMS